MTTGELHDTTVNRLAGQLREVFRSAGGYAVLTRVRCQLLDGFPDCLTLFDVAVVEANPCWVTADGGSPVLPPRDAPVVGVNVVAADTLEADVIRTPNLLARTAVHEYVLFDPTCEVLRPRFQAFVKGEGELIRSWPPLQGVYFSHCDFRLDVRGTDLIVSPCGRGMVEEELFVLRWERERLNPADTTARTELDRRIARLQARLESPRTPQGGP